MWGRDRSLLEKGDPRRGEAWGVARTREERDGWMAWRGGDRGSKSNPIYFWQRIVSKMRNMGRGNECETETQKQKQKNNNKNTDTRERRSGDGEERLSERKKKRDEGKGR